MPQKDFEKFETAKKESLKGDYAIYKPDPLLLMRDNMKLTQMRFFEAYLSKIDATNSDTYNVRIPLDTVAALANIDLSNRNEVRKLCEDIEQSRFDFKRYRERYEPEKIDPNREILRDTFPLFDRFTLVKNKDENEYFIEVVPGVTMSKMLQKYQKNYATYELQEVYSLSNKTNMRMYSCFKRFQSFGTTKLSVELFKGYLGIDEKKYPKTTILRRDVLEPGVKEINKETDIFVTYKPYRKGRSIAGWSFTIKAKNPSEAVVKSDNEVPENQVSIFDVLDDNEKTDIPDHLVVLADLLPEFSIENLDLLSVLAAEHIPFFTDGPTPREIQICHYIIEKVKLMDSQSKKVAKEARFSWLAKAVKHDWQP